MSGRDLMDKCDCREAYPDSKVHGANMGPIWGRKDPGGPHVGPMNFAIWVGYWGIWKSIAAANNHLLIQDYHSDDELKQIERKKKYDTQTLLLFMTTKHLSILSPKTMRWCNTLQRYSLFIIPKETPTSFLRMRYGVFLCVYFLILLLSAIAKLCTISCNMVHSSRRAPLL